MRVLTIALATVVASLAPALRQDTTPIVTEGVVQAPVAAVWKAWTTSEGLRAWLAPHAEIDLRIGGLMRTNYDRDGRLGDARTIENTILSFEPGRMLSIRVAKFPRDFPFPNAIGDMWTVMYFEPAGDDRTRLRIVGLGFRTDEESQKMRAFFERGNAVTLQQLQSHFTGTAR
ncbi:MAG TPA: SRPBCC domain-containing protein [Vicinamibacterales bacterium]|nr:SRPBCC domain-containing protein [Vicinamibacterales bacterium]